MADGEIQDAQMASKIVKDIGGLAVGYYSFSANPTAGDTLELGAFLLEWDGSGGNINAAVDGIMLGTTLDNAVTAINASAALVSARKGVNEASLILVANDVGVAGNITLDMPTNIGAVTVRSGATMLGGKAVAVVEEFSTGYVITADDVAEMAAGAQNIEICVAAIPITAIPSAFHVQAWDFAAGVFFAPTNLIFNWRQINANYFGLFLQDNGPILAAGDRIDVIAIP